MFPVPVVCLPLNDGSGKVYVRVEGGAFTPDEVLSMSMELVKKMADLAENQPPAPVTRLVGVPRG